jgi:DNA repair ATPase RecN
MKASRRPSRIDIVIAYVADAREQTEQAIYALDELQAPMQLIEALERARDELEETEERLPAFKRAARKAA